MLDEATRATILRLKKKGLGTRKIAKALGVSRGAVLDVLADGRVEVPPFERVTKLDAYRDEILALYASCKGNLVRVHEELTAEGADFSYPALTAFCRRHGIGTSRLFPPVGTSSLQGRKCSTTRRRTRRPSADVSAPSRRRRWSCASRG